MKTKQNKTRRIAPAPNADMTVEELMQLLNVNRQCLMRMLNDPFRNVRWYRTSSTKYGRPRIPRDQLDKLRTSNFGNPVY